MNRIELVNGIIADANILYSIVDSIWVIRIIMSSVIENNGYRVVW